MNRQNELHHVSDYFDTGGITGYWETVESESGLRAGRNSCECCVAF